MTCTYAPLYMADTLYTGIYTTYTCDDTDIYPGLYIWHVHYIQEYTPYTYMYTWRYWHISLCIWHIHYIQVYTSYTFMILTICTPLYMAYTLCTGIYTTYMVILTYTPLYNYGMYTTYRNIHHIHIHDDTDMPVYPSVYGIYTIYRYINHIHSWWYWHVPLCIWHIYTTYI